MPNTTYRPYHGGRCNDIWRDDDVLVADYDLRPPARTMTTRVAEWAKSFVSGAEASTVAAKPTDSEMSDTATPDKTKVAEAGLSEGFGKRAADDDGGEMAQPPAKRMKLLTDLFSLNM